MEDEEIKKFYMVFTSKVAISTVSVTAAICLSFCAWSGVQIVLLRETAAAQLEMMKITNERITTLASGMAERNSTLHARLNAIETEMGTLREHMYEKGNK